MDTKSPTKIIGAKVTSRREEAGLSREEVASAANIPLTKYRSCEDGRQDFDLPQLGRVGKALGVELEFWFDGIGTGAPEAGIILTPAEVATKLTLKEQTLANWRVLGKGPKSFRVGRLVRYYASDVDAWIKAQSDSTMTSVAA